MMFDFDVSTHYYFFGEPVDMRKGIHSLYNLIKTRCEFSALNGDAFIFIGVSCKSIKILRWQKDGFILYHKRLELGLYIIPIIIGTNPFLELNSSDFNRLLSSVKYRSIGGELKRHVASTL